MGGSAFFLLPPRISLRSSFSLEVMSKVPSTNKGFSLLRRALWHGMKFELIDPASSTYFRPSPSNTGILSWCLLPPSDSATLGAIKIWLVHLSLHHVVVAKYKKPKRNLLFPSKCRRVGRAQFCGTDTCFIITLLYLTITLISASLS